MGTKPEVVARLHTACCFEGEQAKVDESRYGQIENNADVKARDGWQWSLLVNIIALYS